ncbi:hypothetical protein TR51_03075 [Kitasatospora griseola]|uniref:Uncharacterized protein n=1 Tax=Kitasatospora griseola TaxID=2064 RepID=A0A0D0P4J3_KITGR|nr:hypothetical protein [Kitasatospora griseola]KIQ66556.1 hypothetical protein TR51_03075 [Kitasatospora griseola]
MTLPDPDRLTDRQVLLALQEVTEQTKVDIRFQRIDGRTEFELRLLSQAVDGTALRTLAAAITRLLGPGRN